MSTNSETDKDSGIVIRPLSEMLVDLHVYRIPNELWLADRRLVRNHALDYSISAGFIRVLPELTLQDVRKEIAYQLGYDVLPSEFVFLRGIGKNFAKVRSRQERQFKVKFYLPPFVTEPEIYLLKNPDNLLASSSQSEIEIREAIDKLNGGRKKSKRLERLYYNQKPRASSAKSIGRSSLIIQDSTGNVDYSRQNYNRTRFPSLNAKDTYQAMQLTNVNNNSSMHRMTYYSPKIRPDTNGSVNGDGRPLKAFLRRREEEEKIIAFEEKKSDDMGEADTDVTVFSWDSGVTDKPEDPPPHRDEQQPSPAINEKLNNNAICQRYKGERKSAKNRPSIKSENSVSSQNGFNDWAQITSEKSDEPRIENTSKDSEKEIEENIINGTKTRSSKITLDGESQPFGSQGEITNAAETTWVNGTSEGSLPKNLSFQIPMKDRENVRKNEKVKRDVDVRNEKQTHKNVLENRSSDEKKVMAAKHSTREQKQAEANRLKKHEKREAENRQQISELTTKITGHNKDDKQPEMKNADIIEAPKNDRSERPNLDKASSTGDDLETITDTVTDGRGINGQTELIMAANDDVELIDNKIRSTSVGPHLEPTAEKPNFTLGADQYFKLENDSGELGHGSVVENVVGPDHLDSSELEETSSDLLPPKAEPMVKLSQSPAEISTVQTIKTIASADDTSNKTQDSNDISNSSELNSSQVGKPETNENSTIGNPEQSSASESENRSELSTSDRQSRSTKQLKSSKIPKFSRKSSSEMRPEQKSAFVSTSAMANIEDAPNKSPRRSLRTGSKFERDPPSRLPQYKYSSAHVNRQIQDKVPLPSTPDRRHLSSDKTLFKSPPTNRPQNEPKTSIITGKENVLRRSRSLTRKTRIGSNYEDPKNDLQTTSPSSTFQRDSAEKVDDQPIFDKTSVDQIDNDRGEESKESLLISKLVEDPSNTAVASKTTSRSSSKARQYNPAAMSSNTRRIKRRSLIVAIDDLPDWLWSTNKDFYQSGHYEDMSSRRELLAVLRVLRARRRKAKRIYQDYMSYLSYLRDDQGGYGRIGLAADMWKRKYGEELRETHSLRNQCQRLQQHLETLHHQNSSKLPPAAPSDPSNLASLKTTATKLISDVEDLANNVEHAKIQATAEYKLKTQAAVEAKLLRAEVVDRKIDASIVRTKAQNYGI